MQDRGHRPQPCDDSALSCESTPDGIFGKDSTSIKRKWLTPYDHVDRQPGDRIVLSWDIALSEAETGDYSACVVLLIRGEVFYILEVVRGRFPFNALKRKVMEVKQRYVRPHF